MRYVGCAWSRFDPMAWLRAILPPVLVRRRYVVGFDYARRHYVYGTRIEILGFYFHTTTKEQG